MTSINYNVAANTALRTLQQTNMSLEQTQNRVSTGLKIGEAKDNAAYWSISTTLKSDNKALGTVKDALNLGSATVETAYQGLNKALEVVNEIKSKVTAASQNGVDKNALQSEIVELQKQLTAIATASSFSGENWLSVNSSVTGYNADKSVVASFSRDTNNNVTLGSIEVDTRSFVLIDGSASNEGILDAGKSGNNILTGGITQAEGVSSGAAVAATITPAAPPTAIAANTSGTLSGSVVVNGTAYKFTGTTVDGADATASLAATVATLKTAASADGTLLTSVATINDTTLEIKTVKLGQKATVGLDIVSDGGTGLASVAAARGTRASPQIADTTGTFGPFTLDSNDSIKFDVTVDGVSKTVKIDKDIVGKALGTNDGKVNNGGDYVKVLSVALKNAGISGVTASFAGTTTTFTGEADIESLNISSARANSGESILEIDVTNATTSDLKAYLENISTAADLITSGAALLGAVSSRVELQQTFVNSLVDTIDKGVSNLIDADLSEESTKLQALQTKQQLGIQALSIANSSTQNILSLFRS